MPPKPKYTRNEVAIAAFNIIKKDGIIVCESDSLDKIIYDNEYKSIKTKKYGDKYIIILKI